MLCILIKELYNICPKMLCVALSTFVLIVLNTCLCAGGNIFMHECSKSKITTLRNIAKGN
jgi:hypothetical protein